MLIRSLPMFAPDDEQGGGHSIEDAMAKLSEQRAAAEKPEEPEAPEQNNEPEPAPETGDEGKEPTAEQSDEEKIAAALEREQTPDPNLRMPQGWRGEADEAAFKALTPEVQEKILRREREREAGLNKQLEASALEKKAAAAERDALKAERQRLAPVLQSTQHALLTKLVEEFPGVDPRNPATVTKFALEHPDRYPAYDALWKQIGAVAAQQKRVEQEQSEREAKDFQEFSEKRVSRLLELDESLKDQAKSAAFEKDVVEYLMNGNGYGNIDPERIKHYTAEELLIARKAHLYDKAMAGLKKAAEPAKAPKGVKPGAGVEGKTEQVAALEKRLKSGNASTDDAVALMRLKRKAS